MDIKLSDHFSYKRILRFTLPSILMIVFTSIYNVVDGLFVSNFVNKEAFTAVNFIMPYVMLIGCVGFMFGTGGSAIVGKVLGEGDRKKANSIFTFITICTIIIGTIIAVVGEILAEPVAKLLGAEGDLLKNSVLYARVVIISALFGILQWFFQSFFVTAERPQLGLFVMLCAGIANIILDALFVGLFKWGIVGAAVATGISELFGGGIPLIYFWSKRNKSLLHFVKPQIDWRALLQTCTNGSSELLSNISMSVVNMFYNMQLLRYIGEDGVAAFGVLMYVNLIFIALFLGYSIGTAPIISYNFGAKNRIELKNILKKSFAIIGISSLCMFALGEALASPLAKLFVGYDEGLYALTVHSFRIFSFSFLVAGIGIFGSSFFTALNNGLISAIISTSRTLIFQIVAVFVLPLFWGANGIWASIVIADILASIVSLSFIFAKKNKYQYL